MKLSVTKRQVQKKSFNKQARREGDIPAVFYAPGQESQNIVVKGRDFEDLMRHLKRGELSITQLTLDLDGKEIPAIVKDIQYDVTSYRVVHLDFEELKSDVPVTVKVPIRCTGMMECAGVKLGGVIRQVIRFLRVRCLPKDIPSEFVLDVKSLNLKQSKRLSDIALPEGIRPLARMQEVAVVVAKR